MVEELVGRIDDYLCGGGLFNPELANHDEVRNLLMDCRTQLQKTKDTTEIVGGEVVSDTCPECGSDERFYHCYPFCVMPTIVTCLDCKCPYKTRKKLKENDLL